MNVAKQTISPSTRNKKQKCGLVPLLGLLLNNGKEFTGSYIKKLVELLTFEKMSSLLTTCKEWDYIVLCTKSVGKWWWSTKNVLCYEIAKGCSHLASINLYLAAFLLRVQVLLKQQKGFSKLKLYCTCEDLFERYSWRWNLTK